MPVFQQNCTSQLKDGPLFTELKSQKQQYSLIADVCGTDPSCDDVGYDYPGSEERHHLKKKPTKCPVGGGGILPIHVILLYLVPILNFPYIERGRECTRDGRVDP